MKFGTLKITTSDGKTRDYPIDQPNVSIGRAQGNDLIIEDNSVSRRHARITIESGHVMIEDLASANGVFIGSQRVPPNTPSLVPEQQVVRLGDVALRYSAPPTIEAAQAFSSKPSIASLAPAAAPDGPPINISLAGPVPPVTPGSVSTVSLTLQNRGTVVDEFIIQVTGLPADWVRLSKDRVPLLPNAQETITITLTPPRKAESTAADHPFTLSVISREYRSRATANGTLKVLPFQNFAMHLQPQRSRRDFQLMVNNQGNAPAAYRFGGTDDEQALNYQFGQDAVSLQPGQSGSIPLRVALKIMRRIGAREMRSFNVVAAPLDPAVAETKASGQLIIRPPVPTWLIPLLLLLTVLACVLGAVVYSQRCGLWGENLPLCPSTARPVINVFEATPTEIEKGGTIALKWDVSNADQIELTQPAQETLDKSGVKTYQIDQTTVFTLRAKNNITGPIEKSLTVNLKNSPPVIQSFKADPAVITAGRSDKVVLSWTIAGADAVSIEGVPGAVGATGSVQLDPPPADKTYTLVATNGAGTVKQQITIVVSSAGCVLQSAAEMREGPSDKYRVIDSLAAGTSVAPVGRNATGEWLRVQVNREGWVIASAIQCNVQALAFATIAPNSIPPEPTSTPTATPPPTSTPAPTNTPVPTSPAVGGPWGGPWETSFGIMNLTQSGNSVAGTYNYSGKSGTINGLVTGNHLKGTWTEGANSGSIDWWLGSSGKKWRGNYNAVAQWCGHRSGDTDPTPCGVGTFEGVWTVCAPSCVVTMTIVQDGNQWTATYDNGTMEGTIDGVLAKGNYLYQNTTPGTIALKLLNANQFTGNYDTVHDWCGYRNGAGMPSPCLGP
jgi:hypothetical protein